MAGLPGGEAIISYHPGNSRNWRIAKLTKQGIISQELYDCNTCGWIHALLVLRDKLYAVHQNGTTLEIKNGTVSKVYHIPNVGIVNNKGSLSSDPHSVPDNDTLLLTDTRKKQVFTYKLSSGKKTIRIRNLKNPASVSYHFSGNHISYVVCEQGNHRIKVYNKQWKLVRSFGGFGEEDGRLWRPSAAVVSPEGTVLVADYMNRRISEFTIQGHFIRNLVAVSNEVRWPFSLSFSHPYLWVVQSSILHRYKMYVD